MGATRPAVFGSHDETTLAQLADVASRAERAALMADGRKGYVMPIPLFESDAWTLLPPAARHAAGKGVRS